MTRLGLLIAACGSLVVAPVWPAPARAAAPPVPPSAPNRAAGSSGAVQTSNGAGGFSAAATTGSGAVTLATSPHLITPNLDTPSAINLTNGAGLPLTTGVSGVLPLANGGLGVAGALTSGNVLPGLVTNPVTTGLIAEYPMTEGSGTVVHDISGNGNTANFASGSNAPAWTTWGIGFGSPTGSSLPNTWVQTPVKAWLSVSVFACPAPGPITTGTVGYTYADYFPTWIGTPGASDGVWVLNGVATNNEYINTVVPGIYAPASTFKTTTAAPLYAPCGVLTVTLDTQDHVYWTPVGGTTSEINYTSQGASSSYVTTSTAGYILGSANTAQPGNNGLKGSEGYVLFYSTVLTPNQVAKIAAYEIYQVTNRANYPVPTQSVSQTPQLVFSGDSLTSGYDATAAWTTQTYLNLNNTYNITNAGLSGQTPQGLAATEPLRACLYVAPASGHNVIHLWVGTNSLANSGYTAAQTWAAIQAAARQERACGFDKVIISTMIARGSPSNQNTNKNNLNALIRANWRSVADALNDLAAIPGLGADGAYSNPTYTCFNADAIHLNGPGAGSCYNSLSGYGAVAWNAGRIVNIFDGATDDEPAITSSNAYTEAAGDNVLQDSPTATAAVTLIDAAGLTGQVRKIINLSATYSITVSGSGASGSTIVGSPVVGPNTTAVFRDELISATAGGNEWVRQQ